MPSDTENLILQYRTDLDIFAKARLLEEIIARGDTKLIDLGKKISLKPSYICHIRRLVRLPEIVVDGYYSKLISVSHLFIISRLKDQDKLIVAYERVLTENLTVLQTEEMVRELLYGIKTEGKHLDSSERQSLVESLNKIGKDIKAKVAQTRIKAKLLLEIKGSPDQTSKILKKIIEHMRSLKTE